MGVKGKLKADGCGSRNIFYLRDCLYSLHALSVVSGPPLAYTIPVVSKLLPPPGYNNGVPGTTNTQADKIVRSPTYSISFPGVMNFQS